MIVPKLFAIKLHRTLLSIRGLDAINVLQGTTTNNMLPRRDAVYCGLLNTQGRMVSDIIVLRPYVSLDNAWQPQENEVWVDVPAETGEQVKHHIKGYLFRKKAIIEDISSQLNVWGVFFNESNDTIQTTEDHEKPTEDGNFKSLSIIDPRYPTMGLRYVTPLPLKEFCEDARLTTQEHYRFLRYSNGVLEGKEVEGRLPFLVNLDLMDGISFTKGCYVGQELTARSYHTGIVRKRCFPFVVGRQSSQNLEYTRNLVGCSVINRKSETVGQVLAQQNNIGVMSLNYMGLDLTELRVDDQEIRVRASQTFMKKLKQYQQMIEQRIK